MGDDLDPYDNLQETDQDGDGAMSGGEETIGTSGGAEEAAARQERIYEQEEAREHMCGPGRHAWRHDLCMVCTVCRECTEYSISCLRSMRPDRNPGQ